MTITEPAVTEIKIAGHGDELPRFIDSKQLAKICGVQLPTVQGWRHRGVGPVAYKFGGGTHGAVRFRLDEVLTFVESCREDLTNDSAA